ncbi:hypothetical protein GCM10023194_21670 [Planotetraspora phitsanulokensis]|uniref:Uncharacterized protein n=1 Tax=Planotetraspora phitsanulokensis TaxID=575192 RepID=A0A8J3XEV7_9ACTN|nr:hypothetical protein [Planotetraspora phitsanulokensis]GII38224.1 hypothetical protein Pph01_32270 [Planotetraspora phitsanulokensis]
MDVIHQERVAWEGARAFVAASGADAYWWLSEMIESNLGRTYQVCLAATRARLQREEATLPEIGAWRVRLEDLLRVRPDVQPALLELVAETSARLGRY